MSDPTAPRPDETSERDEAQAIDREAPQAETSGDLEGPDAEFEEGDERPEARAEDGSDDEACVEAEDARADAAEEEAVEVRLDPESEPEPATARDEETATEPVATPEAAVKDAEPPQEPVAQETGSATQEPQPEASTPRKEPRKSVPYTAPAAPASKAPVPSGAPLQVAGLVCALAGAGLAVAANVTDALGAMGDVPMAFGTLIVCGLVLYAMGLARRGFGSLSRDLEAVANQTLRIDQLAHEHRHLHQTLTQVGGATAALQGEMNKLHEELAQLAQIASDPGNQASIFRLAASLDQLHARLETYMKGAFGGLEKRLAQGFESGAEATTRLDGEVAKLGEMVQERHQAAQRALEAAFEELREAGDQAQTCLERGLQATAAVDAKLDQQHAQVCERLGDVGRAGEQAAQELRRDVAELGETAGRHLEEQSDVVRQGFEQLAECMRQSERELAGQAEALSAGLTSLTETTRGASQRACDDLETLRTLLGEVERRLEQGDRQQGALRESLDASTELLGAADQELGERLARLAAQLDGEVRARLDEVHARNEQAYEVLCSAREEFEAGLQGLGMRLEDGARERHQALQQALVSAGDSMSATCRELESSLLSLSSQLESELGEQLGALHERMQASHDALCETRERLAGEVERVAPRLSEELREELAGVQESLQESLKAAVLLFGGDKGLERLGSRLEGLLQERFEALSDDVMALAELAGETTLQMKELRAESDKRAPAAPPAPAETLDHQDEAWGFDEGRVDDATATLPFPDAASAEVALDDPPAALPGARKQDVDDPWAWSDDDQRMPVWDEAPDTRPERRLEDTGFDSDPFGPPSNGPRPR